MLKADDNFLSPVSDMTSGPSDDLCGIWLVYISMDSKG